MANQRKTVIHGISEVGAVRAAADVSFGKTIIDGVTIAFSGTDLDVESGQSSLLEESFPITDRIEITATLLYADLLNYIEALGMDASALVGDLNGGVPTDEVLTMIEGALRVREDQLYIICPGPSGSRRYDFMRTKVKAGVQFVHGRNKEVNIQATWQVLRPKAGPNVFTVTDAV